MTRSLEIFATAPVEEYGATSGRRRW